MSRTTRTLLSIAASLALAPTALEAQGASSGTLLRAADADRSGDVSAAEWKAFRSALAASDGSVQRSKLQALVIAPMLDGNRDGKLGLDDFAALWKRLDAGGSGKVSVERRRRGGMAAGMFLATADKNRDGSVDKAEWDKQVASLEAKGGVIAAASLSPWLEEVTKLPVPANARPGAFTPQVYLMTLDSSLDVDKNGIFSRDDLDLHFKNADTNKDSALSREELLAAMRMRRGGNRAGRGAGGANRAGARGAGRRGGFGRAFDANAKPLMPWQRNLTDALALQKATGKPLLICVNDDGESASERLARQYYRNPEWVKLVEGFIPLIASPGQRMPRDYDDYGRRIQDRRFGRVLNSEIISGEPELYRRFFNGRRVAPRHIGVSKDGKILFDIYLTNDLEVITDNLRKHGKPGALPAPKNEDELWNSPDASYRAQLEKRFVDGGVGERIGMTLRALAGATVHVEILRMAVFSGQRDVQSAAAIACARRPDAVPVELLMSLYAVLDANEQSLLRPAFGRLGAGATPKNSQAMVARRLSRVFEGLAQPSRRFDVPRMRIASTLQAPASYKAPANDEIDALETRLTMLEQAMRQRPKDPLVHEAIAAASLRYARVRIAQKQDPSLLLQDVEAAAKAAGDRPVAQAYAAWAAFLLSDFDKALAWSEAALPGLGAQLGAELGKETLRIYCESKTRKLYSLIANENAAIGDAANGTKNAKPVSELGGDWSAADVADLVAANEVQIAHPLADESTWHAYINVLGGLQAFGHQHEILRQALARFPVSGKLHEYLRDLILRDFGARALEGAYANFRAPRSLRPTVDWYAGLASLFAAERDVADQRSRAALGAYRRCIERFESSYAEQQGFRDSATHYMAFAYAGRARLLVAAGSLREAAAAIRNAIKIRPASAGSTDGLGKSPKQSASDILRALRSAGDEDEADRLAAEFKELGVEV